MDDFNLIQIELPLTEAQRQELDRRLAEAEANPDDSISWDEFLATFSERLEAYKASRNLEQPQ